MKPQKISSKDSKLIDLGTKKIFKYLFPTNLMSVAYMKVDGRNPEKDFFLEEDCSFIIFATKGSGKVFVGSEIFDIEVGDSVFVPNSYKFAVEGNGLEYVTFDVPGFYPEQSKKEVS
ncbi:MAG: hypothetical protein Fur0024_1740 [Patescibacteria group bacterium]